MKKAKRRGLTMLEVMIASIILVFIVGIAFMVISGATTQATNDSANMVMQEKANKLIADITAELRMADSTSISAYPSTTAALIANSTFTDTTNGNANTPVDPLSGPPYASTVLSKAKCPTVPTVTTNYSRYYQIKFNTQVTDSGKMVGSTATPVNTFDFNNTKPSYTRTVRYTQDMDIDPYAGMPAAKSERSVTNGYPAGDGKDNNGNGLIDERVLWKEEFISPATSGTAKRIAYNLRSVAFEIPTAGPPVTRVIIHVMFQDVDSKGKNIWYYTNSTVTVRN